MITSQWIVTYDLFENRDDYFIGKKIYLENAGQFSNKCKIVFTFDKVFIYFMTDFFDFENEEIVQEECIRATSEEIADILSWKYDLCIKEISIEKNNTQNIFKNNRYIISDEKYKNFFWGNYSKKSKEIIEAYREIKNETNKTLRFLMCYRLLEVLSKGKKDIKIFIKDIFPNVKEIKLKRNGDKTDYVSYTRNKIHATDNRYKFPYKDLSDGLFSISVVLKRAIRKEIS